MRVTGAEVIWKALEAEGVDVVFGLPGGAIMPTYDALLDSAIRHVLMRHEQGVGHAAEGYAHVTGRVGVCLTTSGPGACNLVTALTDAMLDSIPLVAITGQVARPMLGRQAFQEAPVTAITAPVTKANWLVTDPDQLEGVLHQAFQMARSGRPGPVLVDVPKDVQLTQVDYRDGLPLPITAAPPADPARLRRAVDLIRSSQRPVLYVGGGAIKAGASRELFRLAVDHQIPVTTTLMARGAFPDSHPLGLGMPGMHGAYAAIMAMQRSDLLIAVGARFDDRVTGRLDGFAPEAKVIHIDIDQAEMGKNRIPDVELLGDARQVLGELAQLLGPAAVAEGQARQTWLALLDQWRRAHPFRYLQQASGPLKPQYVIERLHALTLGDATVTAGVGQHQMWTSQLWRFEQPNRWANSGGLGTMGFAIPAALGAKAARPKDLVLAIDGDGCFQMTSQELATSVAEDLPIVVAIINNGHLGMVRQWQQMFHRGRHSQVHLGHELPDYVRLAESYGCIGLRARSPEQVDAVITRALNAGQRTVVIDFQVDAEELCYPIVPTGKTNDEMDLGPVIGAAASVA